jgi:15-cis-phytoene synthase
MPDSSEAGAPNALSPTRYLAWLYSPPPLQPVFAALCEIESEIAGSLRPGIDHHVAHARLQWWREECERFAEGRPVHPLTRELLKAHGGAPGGTPSRLIAVSGFVDTAVWDLAGATFETRKELTAYCERWASAMFDPAAGGATAVAHDTEAGLRWRTLGAAVREVELLSNLAGESHGGRLRIPLDELERAGVDVKTLAKAPWPAPLANLLRERHQTLRATIASNVALVGSDEQPSSRGLLAWAGLAWRHSLRAERALPNDAQPRRYHALTDGWHAWRAARRATAGTFRLG